MSDSLHPNRLQHARLPSPSLSPRVCSNSSPSCQWCHPTISSSVGPFSIYLGETQFNKAVIQFSSVAQSHLTLCDPVDCSKPGFPVHHQLPELAQTHVHRVGDAIQLSHPLSSLSPPDINSAQYQGLFQWVSSSHQVAKVLELHLKHQSFQSIQDWFPLGLTGLISLLSKGLSRVFSNTTVQKHQFFSAQLSLWSNSHIHTWLLEKT